MATYELDDIGFLKQPAYTLLRQNRSPREASIISRMAILDRSIYRLVTSRGQFNREPDSVAITVNLFPPKALSVDLEQWYIRVTIPLLK